MTVLPPPITSSRESNAHQRPLSSHKGTALAFQAEYLFWVALPWVSRTQPIWMLWRGEAGSQYLTHRALIHLHLSLTALHEELMHFISLFTHWRNPHMGLPTRRPCGSWEVKPRFPRVLSLFTGTFFQMRFIMMNWRCKDATSPKSTMPKINISWWATPGNSRMQKKIFAPIWTWISYHKEDYRRTPHSFLY